jgi:hypothetical protein
VRIVATDAYRVSAKTTSQVATHSTKTSGASANVAPPAVAAIFPPFWKRRKMGRAWPAMAAAAARTPISAPPAQRPSAAAAKPFPTSSSATGSPRERPYTRKTFEAPTFPLPFVRMSSPRTIRGTQ